MSKFKSRTYFRREESKKLTRAIWSPTIRDWRDLIEDYLEISRKRQDNKLAMFKLQLAILGDIIIVNDAISEYTKMVEDSEYAASKVTGREVTEQDIEFWEKELGAYKIVLNSLKVIGDGIAWRTLDFNRSLIYNMCVNNESSGPLTLNTGLLTELNSLGDFTNDTEVLNFVFHGITNFLLISDITVKLKNGETNFIEVKSGKNPRGQSWKSRLNRQFERNDNIVKIGNEFIGESSGTIAEFKEINEKPKTILYKLKKIIKSAETKFVFSKVLYSYLIILVNNFSYPAEEQTIKAEYEKVDSQIRLSDDDMIWASTSLDFMNFDPNRAPLSIYPLSSPDIANILMGRYFINYFFNLSQLFREIEARGYKVKHDLLSSSPKPEKFAFSVHKENVYLKVPPLVLSRIVYEGLHIDSIIKLFDDATNIKNQGNSLAQFYGFKDEKYLWH